MKVITILASFVIHPVSCQERKELSAFERGCSFAHTIISQHISFRCFYFLLITFISLSLLVSDSFTATSHHTFRPIFYSITTVTSTPQTKSREINFPCSANLTHQASRAGKVKRARKVERLDSELIEQG